MGEVCVKCVFSICEMLVRCVCVCVCSCCEVCGLHVKLSVCDVCVVKCACSCEVCVMYVKCL